MDIGQGFKYIGRLLNRFGPSNGGNVALLFGLMLIPIMGIVGMGIEYGNAVIARSKIQAVADSAALAAGRVFQVSGDTALAEATARDYFNAAVSSMNAAGSSITIPDPAINVDAVAGTMTIVATGIVNTSFLRLLNFDQLNFGTTTEAVLTMGAGGQNIEIAMMLDVTGSMRGSKITDMKVAAKDVIEILVANDQSNHTSRVALAPFSRAVKVGSYYQAVTGQSPASSSKTCVTERTGAQKFSDAAPSAGQYVEEYSGWSCKPSAAMVPLTADKALLNATIDAFSATGRTAGHLGTAWAWYLVSPKWNSIWPQASQATAYSDADTVKAVILMTDGQYNQWYSPNGSSDFQARELCDNMKTEGVVVYTVGFELTASNAIQTMQQCATTTSHYYLAENGDELKMAFRDIAFKLAQLRLSK